MKDKFKYVFDKIIDLMRIILYVSITGLIAVLLGEFGGWLFRLIYKIFN